MSKIFYKYSNLESKVQRDTQQISRVNIQITIIQTYQKCASCNCIIIEYNSVKRLTDRQMREGATKLDKYNTKIIKKSSSYENGNKTKRDLFRFIVAKIKKKISQTSIMRPNWFSNKRANVKKRKINIKFFFCFLLS